MARLPSSFDLLLWNMQKCKGRSWQPDFLELIYDKHLLILQEAALSAVNLEIFDQHEEFVWTMARSYLRIAHDRETGVKTGSRCYPQESRSFSSPIWEPLIKTHKMLLQTSYAIEGSSQSLMVINVHAINFSRLPGYRKHLEQVLNAAKAHQGPLILAGDFNTWSRERYRLLRELVATLQLQEARITRKSRVRHLYRHLDHLFYRGLRVDAIELVDSVTSSDHMPIVARLSLV